MGTGKKRLEKYFMASRKSKKGSRSRRKRRRWTLADKILPILLAIILALYIFGRIRQEVGIPEVSLSGKPVKAYFTRRDDVSGVIRAFISRAEKSIHVAVFQIDNMEVARELVKAHGRGVDVKIVTDDRNMRTPAVKYMLKHGIPMVFDFRKEFMHDKFAIIDSQIVITGSANWTDNGFYFNDNNVLIANSKSLALNYEKEFSEMFDLHRFGPESPRNTFCCFVVDSVKIENYFAPEDKVSHKLITLIDDAEKTVHFMSFSFTSKSIAKALIRAKGRGVEVVGLIERRELANPHSVYGLLKKSGIRIVPDGNPKIMHNKVVIIDSSVVITGSYNFTNSADRRNDENVVIVFDRSLALTYLRYFHWLLNSRG